MNKALCVCIVLLAAVCISSIPAVAQSSNPCLATQTWWPSADGPAPIGWSFYSTYPGTFAVLISAPKAGCPPPPPPFCPRCTATPSGGPAPGGPTSPEQGTAGMPIFLATGDTYIQETDVKLPGLGGGISLMRTWNSMWAAIAGSYQVGIFGPNWRSSYEERIFLGSDNYIRYLRGDGSIWSFGIGSNPSVWVVAGPSNVAATLIQGATNWTLTFSEWRKEAL